MLSAFFGVFQVLNRLYFGYIVLINVQRRRLSVEITKSLSDFRKHLKENADEICNQHVTLLVTRRHAPNLVVMSEEDYHSLGETLYLLSSPKNARYLHAALNEKKGPVFSNSYDLKKKMKSGL